jgi:hypothetical protein
VKTWGQDSWPPSARCPTRVREIEATALLGDVRGHWTIENRLHWVRDVTLGEDASQVRSGSAPQIIAALRNTVIALPRGRAGPISRSRQHYGTRRGSREPPSPSSASLAHDHREIFGY